MTIQIGCKIVKTVSPAFSINIYTIQCLTNCFKLRKKKSKYEFFSWLVGWLVWAFKNTLEILSSLDSNKTTYSSKNFPTDI